MKKTLKIALSFCFVMMITTMAAFAQNSNSFLATAGTIRNDVNYSMDPRYYTETDFSNFLTFINVNADKEAKGGYLDLGFAKNFNKLYLGAHYYGDLWGNAKSSRTSPSSNIKIESSSSKCKNEFELLAGIMNMGVKFNFAVDANSTKTTTTTTIPKITTNVSTDESSSTLFRIGGTFGASFDFSPFTLKPIAFFGYHSNSKYDEKAFLMNLGTDFVFDKGSSNHIAGLLYTLYAGGSEQSNIKTSHPVNKIDLYYKGGLKLGSKAELGATAHIINSFDSNKSTNNNGDVVSNVYTYMLNSNAAIGVKYNISPEQFAINAGIDLTLPNVVYTSYPDSDPKKYTTTSDCDFTSRIYTGCELNIGPNWKLDTSLSFQIGNIGNSIFDNITLGVSYRK